MQKIIRERKPQATTLESLRKQWDTIQQEREMYSEMRQKNQSKNILANVEAMELSLDSKEQDVLRLMKEGLSKMFNSISQSSDENLKNMIEDLLYPVKTEILKVDTRLLQLLKVSVTAPVKAKSFVGVPSGNFHVQQNMERTFAAIEKGGR